MNPRTRVHNRSTGARAGSLALALATGLGALAALAPSAGALPVADGDPTSIRALIDAANANPGPDVIELEAGAVYDLTLCALDDTNVGGDLDSFEGALTIEGNGATIRQTCDDERVLHHGVEAPLVLRDLVITGGDTSLDGGGVASNGETTIERSTLTGNTSAGLGGGFYGYDDALHVSGSTISANQADVGGGIYNYGETSMTNSTVVGNLAASEGGGVHLPAYDLVTEFVTIAGNQSPDGANVDLLGGRIVGFATVIAAPVGGDNCASVNAGSSGSNFEEGADTCAFTDPTDIVSGDDAQLGALADNGGTTATMEPAAASPLVDRVPLTDVRCVGADQRDLARPEGAGCEIGAVEIPVETPPETTVPETTVPPSSTPTPAAVPVVATPRFTG